VYKTYYTIYLNEIIPFILRNVSGTSVKRTALVRFMRWSEIFINKVKALCENMKQEPKQEGAAI